MPKTYAQTYLYRMFPQYEKMMLEGIMQGERIDVNDDKFANILYDVKRRQVSSNLIKILKSNNTVLIRPAKTLPKAFKVFVAKDVKNDKKEKVFIDVSDCVFDKDGEYTCNHIDWIIAYLINAMNSYIYAILPNKLLSNQSIIRDGAQAFSSMFSYILDRIYKISTVQSLRKRIEYISAMYYQINILGKDYSKQLDSIKAIAMKVSNIEPRDAQIVDLQIDEGCFNTLLTFTDNLNRIFKFKDLKISIIVDKWMQSFGTGTVFGLEFYPAFAMMLTNTYVGGYIDNQLTIEKIAGQSMVTMTKSILQIGAGVV